MSYKQIKWMILIVPTLTVGLWEYVRHTLLMPYLSMEAGNFLTPVFVFLISMTLLNQLFMRLEQVQEELNKERAENAALAARDLLARELHDGIAQSLFLLSVKMDRAELRQKESQERSDFEEMRKLVHEVNRYVRQAIANLRFPTQTDEREYEDSMRSRIEHAAQEAFICPAIHWSIPDSSFSAKEKVELLACIREALLNTQKHAHADLVVVTGSGDEHSWIVRIDDNGRGAKQDPFQMKDRYGLRIMKERATELKWQMEFISLPKGSRVEIRKGKVLT
ncbi:two-component sensor histidine kinase [Paenibacillus donghaensis]|uniref:sensor histidine kinase n=1 Tax=Paenibacillus donghaensis TaxID=414771 RepID=UPI0018845575|nr:histidine kinase [Paenibacillus donghaensis]MBE9916397.1 two-component sensor histidine kinase [Paenibacillus donghaensis]